jgi:putative glutamine amidotransferase
VKGEVLVSASTPAKAVTTVAALKTAGVAAERIHVMLPDAAGDAVVDPGAVRRRAAAAAGVVLSGGPDVDPRAYGEEPIATANLCVEAARDALDRELAAGARDGAVPVWGICRGMQVLNVFFGGTLWQDVPSQLASTVQHDPDRPVDALVHAVEAVGAETRSGEILGRETALVNSRHHQAVHALAPPLLAVGHSPDGLVEAVELADHDWWVRAVQWHPEDLMSIAQQRALWDEFVAAVAAADRRRGNGASPPR